MIGDKRDTVALTTTADDIDFNADGGSVLVQLTAASGWDGTVDFQTTPNGEDYFNIPYIDRTEIYPIPSTDQIDTPSSTAALYLLLGPLSQVRISCGTANVGTLSIVWRTIPGPYVPMNVLVSPDGDSLVNDETDTLNISLPRSTGVTGLSDLDSTLSWLLTEQRRTSRILELILGEEVPR